MLIQTKLIVAALALGTAGAVGAVIYSQNSAETAGACPLSGELPSCCSGAPSKVAVETLDCCEAPAVTATSPATAAPAAALPAPTSVVPASAPTRGQ